MTEPKVEVVISGIGGLFPECNNLDELKKFLFDKKNAVTSDSRRWTPGVLGTPSGVGKIKAPEKFDNVFFGIHRKMAESLDALTRLSLERSVEAIVDAGINPADLSGTNTAVFMNSCISESEFYEVFDVLDTKQQKGFGLLGHNRAMQANRLSYTLNLHGPSYTTDATWIGGSQALIRAKRMIEDGVINAAIIGSCSLCLKPNLSLQLEGLGRLTNTNETRSFSDDANGMNRSESCVVVLLQKLSEAKRSYATLLGATGIFGETDDLFYHYSDHLYKEILLNAYKEANIDPAKVSYVEGEGLAIKKVDAMELNILGEVFCTPNRIGPLKVGSIKSNVGHCEATSSLVSLAKALIVLDSGFIPPNINYSGPNQDCPTLLSGKLEVVTEKIPLKGDIVGVSSFGLCNSFSHIILKQNKKSRTKIYKNGEMFEDGLPRIIFVSGRNEEGVIQCLDHIKNSQMDEEFAALLQSVFYKSMNAHYYRSFTIVPNNNDGSQEEISYIPAVIKRPIWFVFSGMGSQWNSMGKQLLNIPIFAESVRKCEAILKPKGVDLIDILTNEDPKLFDNILNSFVGIAAIQIGLLDVLKSIDVIPDGIIGHSVGELGCAYADGCFTAEQMILAAYARGRASIETELIDGSMAAIGLGYNDIKDRLPHDIEVACHNASDSSTLSGPTTSVSSFVEQLKTEGVFAKLVNVSNIAYHSQYIKPAAPTLLKYLKEVIPEPKPRSSKWVSSSVPESEWGNEVAKYSSPEYHTNNLLGQVLFEEASRHIPEDAIVIEIAPHGLLQAILKRSLPENVTNIPLTRRNTEDSVKFLLSAFGKMYNNGMTLNIEAFYPSINYPVSRQTQALHSLFPWDHNEEWSLKSMSQTSSRISGERQFTICLNNEHILFDYKINGRHILPSSLLLLHAWKSFVIIQNEMYFDEMIAFEELNFRRNIEIAENDTLEFYSLIQCGSGYFEICLENEVVVSGKILRPDDIDMTPIKPKMKYPDTISSLIPHSSISKHDLYSLLEHNGYELCEQFKTVTNIDLYFEEYRGNIKWDGGWMRFLNGMFTFLIHKSMETYDSPADISTIRKMYIDPSKFKDSIGKDVPIYYNFNTNEINGDGIYILHPETIPFSISALNPLELRLEEEQFVQLANPNCENEINFINNCLQVIFEHKKFQSNPKMNNFKIYYSSSDKKLNQYVTLVKQMLDIQIGIQHTTVSLDKTNPEKFINNNHNIILLPYDQIKNVISILKNTKRVHLLVLSKEPISSTKEWNVIMQQQFNENYLVLIKKIKEIKIIGIKLECITNLQNFYKSVKNSLAMYKKTKSYLYIFTKVVPFVKITRFLEEMLYSNKSNKIRFVFLLDNSGPEFNIDHTFYAEQLRKHLFVNIYKDGKWGTIVRNLVCNSSFNVSTDNTMTTYISDLALDGLKVKYLGINFQDISVNNNMIDDELGHLEYSGITVDGKKMMGIAPFGKNTSNQISPDPHLKWIIPSNQTLEDAATIPISYSIAYYILTVLQSSNNYISEKTILINAGFTAVGQAAITVAISLGYSIYITVENKEQCTLLKNKFPSLPESRIFYYDNIEVKLKIATKGKGVPIIINCIHGQNFHAALRTIGDSGKFFQLTKTDMKNKDKLGLLIFIKSITFYGVSTDSLLNESTEIKLKVQNEVQKGIDLGVVKPFDRHVLTGPCSREKAIQSLHKSSQGVEYNRVVLALEEEKTLGKFLKGSDLAKYQCYSNRVYIIVGSKYSTWIDIAEWIVMRGARKIIVALKKYSMSTTASRRFNLLISRYQNVMIQIVSDSNLNTKEDLILLLKDTTAIYSLGGIFFATLSDEEDKIRNIQYILENDQSLRNMKPIFVCIMSGGENTCTELRTNGVCPNTICLSWSLVATEPNFSNLVPSLDKLLLNIDKMSSSTIICTEYDKKLIATREYYSKMIAELPESIDELNTFGDTVTEDIEFIEVPTSSPRFADSISLPVFVVAGFLTKKMRKMYANLMYPAFEARLPETIDSIEHVAKILVQKLKSITKCDNVSLIGVSWGGAVCLLIAQLLEAENIAVSLTLLEGIPNVLQDWTRSLLQYGNINTKLLLNYFQISSTMAKGITTKNGWNTDLPKVLSSNNVLTIDKTLKALNAIRSRLSALIELRPLPNKIIAKVNVVYRTINVEKSESYKLKEYCVRLPEIISFEEKDYEKLLTEKRLSQFINNNILHYHPDAIKIPITELYKRAEIHSIGEIVN